MNPPSQRSTPETRIPTFRRMAAWLWRALRWLCSPKPLRLVFNRRTLFVVLFLASLIALFYGIEDWRGRRAWEACKRELEAKGEVLDWSAYVPKPVPDAQNMFKVPLIASAFVRPPANTNYLDRFQKLKESLQTAGQLTARRRTRSVTLAELMLLGSNSTDAPPSGEPVYSWPDLVSGRARLKVLPDALPTGRCLLGAQNISLVARPPGGRKPLQIWLKADPRPKAREMEDLLNRHGWFGTGLTVRVQAGAPPNTFRVLLGPDAVCTAADYLEATDPLRPEFDTIRTAAQRPYARIDGNYNEPFQLPYVNFVVVRQVCQVAAQRAQADLLLGRPAQALHELSLLPDVCRFLDGSPHTLVATMIHVAVAGLYTQVVEQGFGIGAWRQPEWAGLQRQFQRINLLPLCVQSFRAAERAGFIATLETYPRRKLARLLVGEKPSAWTSPLGLYLLLCPRGWFYQNAVVFARTQQAAVEAVDAVGQRVDVPGLERTARHLYAQLNRNSAYDALARMAVPNYLKAIQTTTRNQTFANEALIACALERCRQSAGAYPATLDALVPRFVDQLPHDLVNGRPLKYRRTDNGGYRLYSVGWDLKDDGGRVGPEGMFGLDAKDWVWTGAPGGTAR
jgi:hypothetical protein